MTKLVRLVLSMAAVLCMVVMVTFSPHLTTDITTLSKIRLMWGPVASWLRPPYLYLVLNCIIISIFASSKLHEHHIDYSEPMKLLPSDNHYEGEDQSKVVDLPQSWTDIQCVEFSEEVSGNENYSDPMTRPMARLNHVQLVDSNKANARCSDDGTTKGANVETRKRPGSASLVHPKVVKANTEGREKLGVPKPEQEFETLESTWKAITDGRLMPITHQNTDGGNLQNPHKTIKSETGNQQLSSNRNNILRTLAGPSNLGKLKRDPSLGQDELNKRVKEDMRLQRKESLRRYVEMINSNAY